MRRALYFAQFLLAIAIIYWLVATERFQLSAYEALLDTDGGRLIGGIVLAQLASLTLYVARWWGLARLLGLKLTLFASLVSGYKGMFLSLVLPGSLGVDGNRVLLVRQQFPGQVTEGVASIVMDRLTGYIGLLLIGFLSSLVLALRVNSPLLDGLVVVTAGLLIAILVLALSALGIIRMPGTAWLRGFERMGRLLDALGSYQAHKVKLMLSIGLALLTHLFTCIAWLLTIELLGRYVPVDGVFAITSILTAVRTVPITPLGLGVTDGIAEELYRLIGSSVGAEAQMLMRLINSALLVLCGLAFFKKSG